MKKFILKLRTIVLVFLTHRIALPMLKKLRRPNFFTHSMEDLQNLPAGSLGNDLFLFLRNRNLPLLKHYARHDLKHVLLNYDTTDKGEACLQCFMLGNGRVSFPVLATVFYSMITMPEHWQSMREAYRKGKKCMAVHDWQWNELVTSNTADLRVMLFQNINSN